MDYGIVIALKKVHLIYTQLQNLKNIFREIYGEK